MSELTNSPIADFDWDSYEHGQVETGKTREELMKTYDESLNTVKDKEVIEGTVIALNKREAVVNIGYKSDGIIPMSEFRYNPDLKVGDTVEVFIENQEDKKGQLILSHKKARAARSWDRVNEALENNEIIKGYIKCRTKGGMIVDVFGIEAFLPGSQIDVKPIRDYDVFVGKTMEFKVVKINQEFKNVVVSHKALIEAELEQQKKEIIAKLRCIHRPWRRRRLDPHHRPFLGSRKRPERGCEIGREAQRCYPRLRRREEAYRPRLEATPATSMGRFGSKLEGWRQGERQSCRYGRLRCVC